MKKITDIGAFLRTIPDGDKIFAILSSLNSEARQGRYDVNENCYVNFMALKTSDAFDETFEVHKEYADIHFLVDGAEKIYYCDLDSTEKRAGDPEEEETFFVKSKNGRVVAYQKGEAVFLDKMEPHCPGCVSGDHCEILKAVVKWKK